MFTPQCEQDSHVFSLGGWVALHAKVSLEKDTEINGGRVAYHLESAEAGLTKGEPELPEASIWLGFWLMAAAVPGLLFIPCLHSYLSPSAGGSWRLVPALEGS